MTPPPAAVKESKCHIILTLKTLDTVLRFEKPLDPVSNRCLIPPSSTYYYIKVNVWIKKHSPGYFLRGCYKCLEVTFVVMLECVKVCGLQGLLGRDTVFDMTLNLSDYQHLAELQIPVFLVSLLPKILEIVPRERQLSTMVCFSVDTGLFHS